MSAPTEDKARSPDQTRAAGTTRTRQQKEITFPPAPSPTFPTAPGQARGTPTFHPVPNLSPFHRTYNTMAGVAATSNNLSTPRLPGIFTLIEDGANTTPQSRLERLSTLPLEERPPLMVCLEAP